MKEKLNKSQIINYLKQSKNIEGNIEINNNSFTINIKGEFVEKMAKEISLKSIYDLVINLQENINISKENNIKFQENTNKRFDTLEKEIIELKQDNKEIKQRLTLIEKDNMEIKQKLFAIEKDVKEIKELPTINNEIRNKNLKNNRFL